MAQNKEHNKESHNREQDHSRQHQHEHGSHDHSGHHKMMIKDFRRRFWISTGITIPILILSPMIQDILGYNLEFGFEHYLLFGLSAFVYFYGGWPFLKGLRDELSDKQPGMMTLIAVAITVAFGYSTATTFGLEGKTFFWELATLIDIMLLGHWLEMRSVLSASRSLEKLVELMPEEANLLKNGDTEKVKIDQLKEEDKIVVYPGEKIPADGKVTDGSSHVNESMVTGESKPVKKEKGSKVTGGTINGNGSLTVSVEKAGKEAYLNKVVEMVQEAQDKKSKTQRLADRIAFWLTIIALTVGFGTLAVWIIYGKEFVFALERMASVMVITCPHALGLAVPLVAAISTSIAAQKGLLIRNRTAFENSGKISLLVFDKTGTLTEGKFGVSGVVSFDNDQSEDQILKIAAAVESKSEHPLAKGILDKAKEKKLDIPEVKSFNSITGKGIEGKVNGREIKVVGPGYLKENNIDIPENAFENDRETVVFLLDKDKPAGCIALEDSIRKESYEAVDLLKNMGIKLVMMTGDNKEVAKSVSEELGLDEYYAGIFPDRKLEKIEEFQKNGEYVAMTGDGINDAPALAAANVGIAVGSGTDIAAETADIILVNSNPKDIASLIIFGKKTYNKMIQNFVWATGYNVVTIPLAAGVLYSAGILINPALGAVLMSISTIIVAINAQLLKRKI